MENYDEVFSVHQKNRSPGITLRALCHSLVLLSIGAWRIAQSKSWKALRSNGDLFSTKFMVEPDTFYNRFLEGDLVKIYLAVPRDDLVVSFGPGETAKGLRCTFSPKGKLALMFLKHWL